tara:strand:+ start:16473 stop:17561 length:1089 start_codon:yes stop_codon:yes gene_type:complete
MSIAPLRVFSLLLGLLLLVISPLSAFAQVGVGISPALIEETLDPGTVKEYEVEVENKDGREQTFYLFTRNIADIDAGGVPIFAPSNFERTCFELAEWLTLPITQVTIPGRSATSVAFTLAVPDSASPGSHFGGVFVSVEPPEIENSGAAVGYQVATPVSIRVSGEAVERANIRQFSTTKFLYGSQNVDFKIRIENTGNVLVRPTGPLEIKNMLGNKVASFTFNEDGKAVFPTSNDESCVTNNVREFSDVKWEGDSVGFGRYEAVLSPVYGDVGARKTMSSTVTFWILPMSVIGPALAVLAVILLITFIFVRLYIRRSLAHLNQGRRVIRRQRRGGPSGLLLLTVVMLSVTSLFLIVLLALFA